MAEREPTSGDPAGMRGTSRASSAAPQALAMVLASGVGALAAFGLGSASAWIVLPLAGATVPLWPRLARALGRQASGAARAPVGAWSARRLPTGVRWGLVLGALVALAVVIVVTVNASQPTLGHLLGIVAALVLAIGAWAWQFCAPESLGRRIGTCVVGWAVGLSGNWVASATDCSNTTALVTRVRDAAFAGAKEGAREGVRDALADADMQERLATRIAEKMIARAPGLLLVDGRRPGGDEAARIAGAVVRAKVAADAGDAEAAAALAAAENGRTEDLLAFLGREAAAEPGGGPAGGPEGDDELIEMHREIAALAELAGDSRTALESYEQILKRRPGDADTLTRAAALVLGTGARTLEAKAMYERARDAATRPEEQFWAVVGLGDIAERISPLAEALRQHRLALQIATRMSERNPLSTEWKRNVSVAHLRIGNVQANQGLGDEAVASHRASIEIKRELLAADPGNTTYQRDLCIGETALGRVHMDRGETAEATVCLYRAFEAQKALTLSDPTNTLWKRDAASITQDLGNAREAAGDFPGALGSYQESVGILEELRQMDPENTSWARDLSIAHNNTADVLLLMGKPEESLRAAEAAMAIASGLVSREPSNTQWQRDLAMCHYRVGDALLGKEDAQGALEAFGAGLAIVERLGAGDGANMSWKRDVYVGRDRMGDARSRFDLAGAIASYESALEVADAMAALDPENPAYERDRASSLRSIGLASAAAGNFERGLEATLAERAIRASIVERDPVNVARRRDLGLSEYMLGLINADLGRMDEARARASEAARILAGVSSAAPANAEWRRDAEAAEALVEQLGDE